MGALGVPVMLQSLRKMLVWQGSVSSTPAGRRGHLLGAHL